MQQDKNTKESSRTKVQLAENIEFPSTRCHAEGSINVLCVGQGENMHIIEPNLKRADVSYVITDPGGALYEEFAPYLKAKGYQIRHLNFRNTADENHYNFFDYIKNDNDIEKIVEVLVSNMPEYQNSDHGFWKEATRSLFCAFIAYLFHHANKEDRNMSIVMQMIRNAQVKEDDETLTSPVDTLFDNIENKETDFSYIQYQNLKMCTSKTLRSILVTATAGMRIFDLDNVKELTNSDDLDLYSLTKEKTAIFIELPLMDRSFDALAEICCMQALQVADAANNGEKAPCVPCTFFLKDITRFHMLPKTVFDTIALNVNAFLFAQPCEIISRKKDPCWQRIINECFAVVCLGSREQTSELCQNFCLEWKIPKRRQTAKSKERGEIILVHGKRPMFVNPYIPKEDADTPRQKINKL